MFSKNQAPIFLWKWSYILVNLSALIIMLVTGEMMGDAQGLVPERPARLIVACIAVVSAYWILLGPFYKFLEQVEVVRLKFGKHINLVDDRFGVFLIVAQLCFMGFNLFFGVNVAGSATTRADSALGLIWVVLPVDTLVLIYYAVARDNRFFRPNIIVYVISNVMRGWSGIFLFIIFLEMCRAAHAQRIKWKRIILFSLVVLIFYPVLLNFKWLFRAAVGSDIPIIEGAVEFFNTLSVNDYMEAIGDGVKQIVGRLQLTSSVEQVIRYSGALQDAFDLGTFKPFWLEGLHGIIFDKLWLGENRPAIGVAFTAIGNFTGDFDVGAWNTNTAWVGWFFVAPMWIPAFLMYTGLLCYLSFFFTKNIGDTALLRNLNWFAWLVFLMPGWLGAFFGFVYALMVCLLLRIIFAWAPKISLSLTAVRR